MISQKDIPGTCTDGIKSLRASLWAFWQEHRDDVDLIMHKSNVMGAYHNCFDCRSSYYVYLAFILLVCWIAEWVKHIKHFKCYIDDNCSFSQVGDVKYYPPYSKYFLSNWTKLLELWDKIGLPHEERKQIYSPIVLFISFDVDSNLMSIPINEECKQALIHQVIEFAQPGKCQTLKEFQSVAGHVNWSLTVFLMLKPSLSAVYAEMTGKPCPLGPIRVNNAIHKDLLWFAKHTE
jgi:hypothetical protein